MDLQLLFEAVISGVLLGCFYAAVSLGLSIAFGLDRKSTRLNSSH